MENYTVHWWFPRFSLQNVRSLGRNRIVDSAASHSVPLGFGDLLIICKAAARERVDHCWVQQPAKLMSLGELLRILRISHQVWNWSNVCDWSLASSWFMTPLWIPCSPAEHWIDQTSQPAVGIFNYQLSFRNPGAAHPEMNPQKGAHQSLMISIKPKKMWLISCRLVV